MTKSNFSFISISIITVFATSQANADMATGKAWLENKNNNKTNTSHIANPLQSNQETAQTLQLLQSTSSNSSIDLNEQLKKERSTEGLVRLILLSHSHNSIKPLHSAWQYLKFNQNEDGGFAHIENWQSNPLDTAFFLIALHETDYLGDLNSESKAEWQAIISKALAYLANQQRTEGNYSIAHLDDLYTSSYVLSAFTPYLVDYGQYIPTTKKLVTYLDSKQTTPATWSDKTNNKGLFLDALVAESLYPYQSSDKSSSFSQAFETRALSLQNADGSWQEDSYVTALVLRSMDRLSKPTINPVTSAISLSVVDAETGLSLSGVSVKTDASSAQQVTISSDSQGNVVIKDSKEGSYIFTLSKDGYASVQFSLTLKRGEQLNLGQVKLSRADSIGNGQIQGTVKDNKGNVITGSTITVMITDASGNKLDKFEPIVVTSNTTGGYQVVLTDEQQNKGGYFTVVAKANGYISSQSTGQAKSGGVVMFNPVLMSEDEFNASMTGLVVDETGQLLSGVTITNGSKTVSTDASGVFTVSQIDLGSQQWTISKEGYSSSRINLVAKDSIVYQAGTITLRKANSSSLVTGNFKVSVKDKNTDKGITGYTLVAEQLSSNGDIIQTQSFNADGEPSGTELLLSNLETGTWRLTVSHPSYISKNKTFELANGVTIEYAPDLLIKPYIISGTVVDSQTDLTIVDAPVKVIDDDTDTLLFEGTTDSNGHFVLPEAISASNIRVEINPDNYLSTTRYVNRDFESTVNVDMGQIRLRPKSATVVWADLLVSELDSSQLSFHQQLLTATGTLTATIENRGRDKLSAGDVKLTAWVDSNTDRKLDEDEQVLGMVTLSESLAIDESTQVAIEIDGKVNFREAPIAVMVDSEGQVAESNEKNNVRLTSDVGHRKQVVSLEYEEKDAFSGAAGAIVAPLEDTNKDGVIGLGDVSSIIVRSVYGGYNVLDGQTTQTIFSIEGPSSGPATGLVAVGDVDNDGLPEIISRNATDLLIYSNKGKIKHKIPAVLGEPKWSSSKDPIIANIDNEGLPEIIYGDKIFNYEKGLVTDNLSSGISQAVADINMDGKQEILGLTGVTDYHGNIIYKYKDIKGNEIRLSHFAIGKFDDLEYPQIVTHKGYKVLFINGLTGQVEKEVITDRSNGGPPSIADLDNDGKNDISIIASDRIYAIRYDGSIIWQKSISESSGTTGSTIFDLNNDGKMEVCYYSTQPSKGLRCDDGETGSEFFSASTTGPTAHEYPIIADVDADGSADIITNYHIVSAKNKDWANTRNIWNQYSYHVTNINDDLSIPKNEPNSWEVHNTYRANLLLDRNSTATTDLTASYIQVDDRAFFGDSTLTARIGNAGGKTVPVGTPVSFYRIPQDNGMAGTPELLQTVNLTKPLIGGTEQPSYEDLSIKYDGSLADFGELVVVANDAGAGIDSDTGIPTGADEAITDSVIQEYSRGNNTARLSIDGGFAGLTLTGDIDKPTYTANSDIKITAVPSNLGSFPSSPIVKTEIIDSVGNVIATLPEQEVDLTSALITDPGNSQTLNQIWNTGSYHVGAYIARITLWKTPFISGITGDAEQVAQVNLPFTIIADGIIDGEIDPNSLTNSLLSVDKVQYLPTDQAQIHSRLLNSTSNAIATQRDVTITVTAPDGTQIWTESYSHNQLIPNAIRDQYFTLPLSNAPTGDYTVTQTTTAPDGSQETQVQTQSFKVLSATDTGYGIAGEITAPNEVQVGEVIDWSWQIDNTSDTNLTNIPLSIALFKGDSAEQFETISLSSVNIDKDGKVTGMTAWTATGTEGEQITAVLVANFNGNEQGLATVETTLIEPPINISIGETNHPYHSPLLVYYSCEAGWKTFYQNSSYGAFDFPCFDERANSLKYYLDSIDVPYKLVKRPEHFADAIQSGLYEQYWLVGALEELRPHTRKELTELAHTGDNLLMDSGVSSWRNQNLLPLAGSNQGGRLLLTDGTLLKQPNYLINLDFFSNPQTANTPITIASQEKSGNPYYSSWAIQLEANDNSNIWAKYSGQRKRITRWAQNREDTKDYPAIISQKYGNGEPVALGFDLINSLDLARSTEQGMTDTHIAHWQAVLKHVLSDRQAYDGNLPTDYVPYEVVHIPLIIDTQSSTDQQLTVDIDLPSGSQWLGSEGGTDGTVFDSINDSVQYQINIKAGESLNDLLTIRLPATSGTHAVRISVSATASNKQIEQYEARYLVRSIESRIQILSNTIKSWRIWGTNGMFKLNAKTQMTNIRTNRRTGVKQLAVYEASRLATTLAKMQKKDNSPELAKLRYEADELMRALQIDWYIDRDGYVPLP